MLILVIFTFIHNYIVIYFTLTIIITLMLIIAIFNIFILNTFLLSL